MGLSTRAILVSGLIGVGACGQPYDAVPDAVVQPPARAREDAGLGGDAAPSDCCVGSAPPGPQCADACQLQTFGGGRCESGVCVHPLTSMTCAFGCSNGACAGTAAGGDTSCQATKTFEAPGTFPLGLAKCSRLSIRAWGAGGGDGAGQPRAGAGGFASAVVDVDPAATVMVVVGGAGAKAVGSTAGAGGSPGGGGAGGNATSSQGGGGGGGFSGVFLGTVAAASALVVAGGGGGGGGGSGPAGGAGGGSVGGGSFASGGTQIAGFAPLQGGPGGRKDDGGGGGGGGWFGGTGGSGATSDAFGGGGGSAFVVAGATASTLTAGEARTPGNAADPTRKTAADPGTAGIVVVSCFAFAP